MENLKKIRRERKITQQKLADYLNVSRSTLSMWEINASQPDMGTIKKLSSFFNVSTDYLLGNTDDLAPQNKKEHQTSQSDVQELYDLLISTGIKDPDKPLSDMTKTRLFTFIKNNSNLIAESDNKTE